MPVAFVSHARLYSALAISVPIVVEDLRRRRIPNWTCVILLTTGLALGAIESGIRGFGLSLAGAVAGLLIFIVFYVLGGMGAGDVKLMAACGALVGLRNVVPAALVTALTGAAIAMIAAIAGALRRKRPESIPYAPAILSGALLVLLGRTG